MSLVREVTRSLTSTPYVLNRAGTTLDPSAADTATAESYRIATVFTL
jgi:hypothetical protein